MTITNAQYYAPDGHNVCVQATINGTIMSIPLNPDNMDYAEILKQVEAGTLTFADAE